VLLASWKNSATKKAAQRSGCPIGTIRSRLHRGRALLMAQLEILRDAPRRVSAANAKVEGRGVMKCEEFEAIGLERSGLRMSEVEADLQDAGGRARRAVPRLRGAAGNRGSRRAWALQALRETNGVMQKLPRGAVEMQLVREFGLRPPREEDAHGCDFCGLGAGYGGRAVCWRELVEFEIDTNSGRRCFRLEMA